MGKRPQVSLNLPLDVEEAWCKAKRGVRHTRFGMATLAAFALLDSREQDSLMLRAEQVDNGARDWTYLVEWVVEIQAKRKAAFTQAVLDRFAARGGGKRRGKPPRQA